MAELLCLKFPEELKEELILLSGIRILTWSSLLQDNYKEILPSNMYVASDAQVVLSWILSQSIAS